MMKKNWLQNKYLIRTLIIVPPILFVAYSAHSLMTLRSLLSDSSSFHLDYANELVQDYLDLDMALELERWRNHFTRSQETAGNGKWFSIDTSGPVAKTLTLADGKQIDLYLKRDSLAENLTVFFDSKMGLRYLFSKLGHEPVYWFQILDGKGDLVYRSGTKPAPKNTKTYPMDRSLTGYQIEIIYSSFGPQQLYSVARTRINFGAIFFLFLLVVFSVFLVTRSIRQKIILAKQKTFFVSTVSHEFKTPLAIMKLAAETLAGKRFNSPAEEQRFLGMLTNEINRLDHLVHKVLSFSKIEMGQVMFHNQRVDLREVLHPSIDIFSAQATAEGIVLDVTLCEQPCPIYGDAELIRHAIDNILDNAFKYRGESDRIEFHCRRDEKAVQVMVRDHGIGMAEEEISQIGKSFYRINDPIVQGVRGSGLGLAISRYILKHSKANMAVESGIREGSTFTISFPLAEE